MDFYFILVFLVLPPIGNQPKAEVLAHQVATNASSHSVCYSQAVKEVEKVKARPDVAHLLSTSSQYKVVGICQPQKG